MFEIRGKGELRSHRKSVSFTGSRGWDSSKGRKRGGRGRKERRRGVVIRVEECARTRALLPSYVRTTAPEFDLIFPRKEIKRKWPTGGARLFFRKPLKIFETVAVTLHCRLSKIFPPPLAPLHWFQRRFQRRLSEF